MKLKSFSIIGIGGVYKLTVTTTTGAVLRRRFNNISHCFKWLKGIQSRKHYLEV